mmetsp:Transcript_35821/g.114746  ORF Transcript_35821/g.114746 Transcript_35821/m.114746 type:complete len:136 (+) Transcript_35821:540-947(+)
MRSDAAWDFAVERASLDDVASAFTYHKLRAADVQLEAARQQNNYMRLYQTYNSQIQHYQSLQFTRPSIPMNAAFAYRFGGKKARRNKYDVSLSGSLTQGKAQFQLTKLDDDTILAGDPSYILAPGKKSLGFSLNA